MPSIANSLPRAPRAPHVAALYIYPLKGARRIALDRSAVLRDGLRHDRRFMALDAKGTFVTQRSHPRLALVETAIEGGALTLSVPSGARATVPLAAVGPRRTVTVWDDEVVAVDVPGDAAALLTAHLGERCTLVRMPEDARRIVDPEFAKEGDHVGFADGFPVLIACLASLADLNARLETPVGIERFRANVIVEGGAPWAEEEATAVRIGDLSLRTPKRCSRCQVITVDQDTAAVGKEPLRTLASFRKVGAKVHFAMNAIPDQEGTISVGDPVSFV